MMDGSFSFEEHTADISIRVEAKSLPLLFAYAGRALSTYIFGEIHNFEGVMPSRHEMNLSAPDRELLLFDWLMEILYRANVMHKAFLDTAIHELSEAEISAEVIEIYAEPKREVKAVTLNSMYIREHHGNYEAWVTLDL